MCKPYLGRRDESRAVVGDAVTSYRTRFRPPLAHGGHSFALVVPARAPGPGLLAAVEVEAPAWFRCTACYETVPSWAIVERFYSKPCRGLLRAIEGP